MNILCCRAWGIGNMLAFTPALAILRMAFPDARIDLITERDSIEVIRGNPELRIDNYYTMGNEVDDRIYDVVIYAHPGTGAYSFRRIPRQIKRDTEDYTVNEIDSNIELIRGLLDWNESEYNGLVYCSPKIRGLKRIGFGRECRENFQKKKWPYWNELKKMLVGYDVIELGYPERTSIPELISIMKGLDMFVAIDNGLSHIARGLGLPTVILVGPTVAGKCLYGIPNEHIIEADPVCPVQPCYKGGYFTDCGGSKCMESIKPETVFKKVMDVLAEKTN